MDQHRRTSPLNVSFSSIIPPFSCFDYVEENYGGQNAIRRIFSLARSFEQASSLISEEIRTEGIIAEENSEILSYFPDFLIGGLRRLSFWSKSITADKDFDNCTDENLLGYAILKRDISPSQKMNRWYIFEAVFRKYPHPHNCVPFPKYYRVAISNREFRIPGLLYCQQNNLNKVCAHVGLRSLLSRLLPESDISYSRLNQIARSATDEKWSPNNGLQAAQIRRILDEFRIGYRDVAYSQNPSLRMTMPYQKWAYAGVESGSGSLVGFRMGGSGMNEESCHIIPFYGHTFNKDTWAPDADVAYFHIGEGIGYIPSESWTSSFIGHDDNFGPNFCIPRFYISQDKVEYVVELLRNGTKYSGVQAEALGLGLLYSVIPHILPEENRWLQRLIGWTNRQQIVLRALALEKAEYIKHISRISDWEGNRENPQIAASLETALPDNLWMIEISTPHLFPANERKLGEIVLDASVDIKNRSNAFQLARLPSKYVFGQSSDNTDNPVFSTQKSSVLSHSPLCSFD